MEEKCNTGVFYNRKENSGYGARSKYLSYSIESQVTGFVIHAWVIELFYR